MAKYMNTNTGDIYTAEEIEVLYNQFQSEIEESIGEKFSTFSDYINHLVRKNSLMEIGDKVYTADRESGTFIEEFETVDDAKVAIGEYEEFDREDGTYEPGFYDVVDENHVSLI